MRRRIFTYSEVLSELENVIPVIDAVAGDVLFYSPELDDLVIRREPSTWNLNEEPIGIVVIPGSHNVYDNGSCGVMSLMSASCDTPDTGSTSNERITWGQYETDISELFNYGNCVYSKYKDNDAGTVQGVTSVSSCYLPSDKFTYSQCSTDALSYYVEFDKYMEYGAPSPYLNDGSRNPAYYQTTTPSDIRNCLSDFKGKENTEILISKHGQSNWKTASYITNSNRAGYSPAACACWRYSTTGTKQGDWYFPAIGELGYAFVRMQKINDTISALQLYFNKTFCLLGTEYPYRVSTEMQETYSWILSFNTGYIYFNGSKSNEQFVRPFMQFKYSQYKFVDMGLSVDWCTCNIGATKPEEYGWYFQWGGTKAYNSDRTSVEGGDTIDFDWESYPLCNGSISTITKYNSTDNKTVLELIDDAAYAHLGEDCHIPTEAEYQELIDACNIEWKENYNDSSINGCLFTLKTDMSKKLFFPAAGDQDRSAWYDNNVYGRYWVNSINNSTSLIDLAKIAVFNNSNSCKISNLYRYRGISVRAVRKK